MVLAAIIGDSGIEWAGPVLTDAMEHYAHTTNGTRAFRLAVHNDAVHASRLFSRLRRLAVRTAGGATGEDHSQQEPAQIQAISIR
jgi:hypothetical protein